MAGAAFIFAATGTTVINGTFNTCFIHSTAKRKSSCWAGTLATHNFEGTVSTLTFIISQVVCISTSLTGVVCITSCTIGDITLIANVIEFGVV